MPRIAIAMEDFGAAVATFRDLFGMPVADFSARTVPQLGAHVGMCQPPGGSNIELMAPADPTKPLSQALARFLELRGEGLYALMLEAPDPDAEAEVLAGRGLAVLPLMAGASGRDVHPRSTHGVLIRVYPDGSVADPGHLASGAPGLSGITRVVVATDDASLALDAYGTGLGLDASAVVEDGERGVASAICRPPKGGVIELVSAVDSERPFAAAIESFVKEQRHGMYALMLSADDPDAAFATLVERGATVEDAAGRSLLAFGARIIIEGRS
ncbi:MAG: VOC family protein [Acidimicrobiia bacterium]|nr:VOC family protein [Acidimicrobiia bacterium]